MLEKTFFYLTETILLHLKCKDFAILSFAFHHPCRTTPDLLAFQCTIPNTTSENSPHPVLQTLVRLPESWATSVPLAESSCLYKIFIFGCSPTIVQETITSGIHMFKQGEKAVSFFKRHDANISVPRSENNKLIFMTLLQKKMKSKYSLQLSCNVIISQHSASSTLLVPPFHVKRAGRPFFFCPLL